MGLRIHYTGIEIDGNRFPSVLTLSPSLPRVSRLFLLTPPLSLSLLLALTLSLLVVGGAGSLWGSRVISPRFHNAHELRVSSDGTNSIVSVPEIFDQGRPILGSIFFSIVREISVSFPLYFLSNIKSHFRS